jgi:hypothetical protein
MKKLILLGLFFLVIGIFSQSAHALTYTITSYPGRPAWSGGAFLINGSMATYCLEVGESITLGVSYYGTIDDYAIKGGGPSSAKGGGPVSAPNKDYLDVWSEWLVAKYLNDSLTNPNKMKDFQNAIWYIEGEIAVLPLALDTDYYALVDAVKPTQDIPWIRVLNLYSYDLSGKLVDNQSVIITPEPGTLLLLGAGLLGLGFLVRRKFRSLN